MFQSQGNESVYEYVVAAFMVALFALAGIYVLFIIKSFKNQDIQDNESKELFTLSKKQKICICVKAGLVLILLCFIMFISHEVSFI